ncbi:MAG: HD domain-containing protein [Dehalogenimonas sp.]
MTEPMSPDIVVPSAPQRAFIAAAAETAASLNTPAAVVGGFLRDTLLGRPSPDLDLAVFGDTGLLARHLAKSFNGTAFTLSHDTGMFRVSLPPGSAFEQIDLGTAAGTLEADLKRRDFTADALGAWLSDFDAVSGKLSLVDATGSIADIEQRCLRAVTPEVFRQDPARLLRGVRLAAELGFTIDPDTADLIRAGAAWLSTVAGERTREELLRLLSLPGAGANVEHLDQLGLLNVIFPEMEASRGIEQPKEHAWDVFNHQLQTIYALDWIMRQGHWPHAEPSVRDLIPIPPEVTEYFNGRTGHGAGRLALTRLAALLHDISKPETKILTDSGRIRFFGHAQKGAEVVKTILERLRFSNRETILVTAMVRAHLRPVQMGPERVLPTPRAVFRYLRDTGEGALGTLYLSLADHLAARGPALELDNFREHVTIVSYILAELERQSVKSRQTPLITGHELQQRFGLKPGPKIGAIMAATREAQATGELHTPEEAAEFVREFLNRPEGG